VQSDSSPVRIWQLYCTKQYKRSPTAIVQKRHFLAWECNQPFWKLDFDRDSDPSAFEDFGPTGFLKNYGKHERAACQHDHFQYTSISTYNHPSSPIDN